MPAERRWLWVAAAVVGCASWAGSLNAEERGDRGATPLVEARPAELAAHQTVLTRLLDRARRSAARPGGLVHLEQRRSDLDSAIAARHWLAFLPDLAVVLRHERSDAPASDPLWRLELQARAVLSLEKWNEATAAGEGKEKARAAVALAQRDAWRRAFDVYLALYLAERRVHQLGLQRRAVSGLIRGLARTARADSGELALRAHLAGLDRALAEADHRREQSRRRLAELTEAEVKSTELPPELTLDDVFTLITRVAPAEEVSEVTVARAEVALQQARLRLAQSRHSGVPELRAGAWASFPERRASAALRAASGWDPERILTELTLALQLRPAETPRYQAQAAAVERSEAELAEARLDLARARAEAQLTLESQRAAWRSRRTDLAEQRFRETSLQFARGERDASAAIDASDELLRAQANAEVTLAHAAASALLLASVPRLRSEAAASGVDPSTRARHDGEPAPLTATEHAPRVRATRAEARRAEALLGAARHGERATLELGVIYPLTTRNNDGASTPSLTPGGATPLVAPGVSETSALVRGSLDLLETRRAERRGRAEARLRHAEQHVSHQRELVRRALARLSLAHARARLAQAEREVEFARQRHRTAARELAELVTDDRALVQETEREHRAAEERRRLAAGAAERALVALNALLGRPLHAPWTARETPNELLTHLRHELYPREGLVGSVASSRRRLAALQLERDEAELAELRQPARGIAVFFQGAGGLTGQQFSLSVGISGTWDPVQSPPLVLEAAERLGTSRGRAAAVSLELARDRRRAASELELARQLHATEQESRAALERLERELTTELDASPGLHPSTRARSRAALQAQIQGSERRLLELAERWANAELRALELGVATPEGPTTPSRVEDPAPSRIAPSPAHAKPAPPPTATERLPELIARSSGRDPELVVAQAAARAVDEEDLRPALLAGFHPVGPVFSASAATRRDPSGARPREVSASAGVGLSYGLDEGLSFLVTEQQDRAAQLALAAERRRAAQRALQDVSALWTQTELHRLALEREARAGRRWEALALPRFHAAHVGPAALASAQAELAEARREVRAASAAVERERAALAERGVVATTALEQQYREFTSEGARARLLTELATLEERELAAAPDLAALRARAGAAIATAALSPLRVVGPVVVLAEGRSTWRSGLAAADRTPEHQLDAVYSLIVPVAPRALGEIGEAVFRARVRSAEVRVREHALQSSLRQLRSDLQATERAWRAALAERSAAHTSLARAEDRHRAGFTDTSLETLTRAEDALGQVERDRVVFEARLRELTAALRVLAESPGSSSE